jgi:hypothetical protein
LSRFLTALVLALPTSAQVLRAGERFSMFRTS